jgi:hypothetical protein
VTLLAAVDVLLLARLDELPIDVGDALEVGDDLVQLAQMSAVRLRVHLQLERGAAEDAVDQLVVVVALEEALAEIPRAREEEARIDAVAAAAHPMTGAAVLAVERLAVGRRWGGPASRGEQEAEDRDGRSRHHGP